VALVSSVCRAALGYAGYDLGDHEAYSFFAGFGTDKNGKLDALEVLQAVSDILIENTIKASKPAENINARSRERTGYTGNFVRGTPFGDLERSGPPESPQELRISSLGWTEAERKIYEQYHAPGSQVVRGKAVMRPFLLRDPFDDGKWMIAVKAAKSFLN